MKLNRLSIITSAFLAASTVSFSANATIVLFKTSMGDFEVNLFDNHTPQTVENFLKYVENTDYSESFIHRKSKNFVVQGGGFSFNTDLDEDGEMIGVQQIESLGKVKNEPVFSNIRGTISMAKVGGDPDSATNQWFFNLNNNAANLDNQNGGFTAFGRVSEEGMEIIDTINDLPNSNFGGALTDTPIQNTPAEGEYVTNEHLVMIESVTVVNSNTDTQPVLPPESTSGDDDSDGGGGGSMNFFMLCAFAAGACRRFFGK